MNFVFALEPVEEEGLPIGHHDTHFESLLRQTRGGLSKRDAMEWRARTDHVLALPAQRQISASDSFEVRPVDRRAR